MNKKELGDLMHNINNPLQVVVGSCSAIKNDIVKNEVDNDELLKRLNMIEAAAFRMAKYIKDLDQ